MPTDGPRVIKVVLPNWLQALKPVARVLIQFGRNPVAFVFSLISLYIANAVLGLFQVATGAVLWIYEGLASIFDMARVFLISGFGSVGIDLLNVVASLGAALNRALFALGPAAPFVVAFVGAAALYGLYRLGIGLLGEVPIGSTVVDVLRLR